MEYLWRSDGHAMEEHWRMSLEKAKVLQMQKNLKFLLHIEGSRNHNTYSEIPSLLLQFTIRFHKQRRSTLLANHATIEYHDMVGIQYRSHSVGNDDNRLIADKL